MHFNVDVDIAGALRMFAFTEKESNQAIARALNKTVITGRKAASDEIKQAGYGLKVSDIKDAISISRANYSKLEVSIRAKGRSLGLIRYQARQTQRGVTAKVKGTRSLWPGAFITVVKNGHKGVFVHQHGMQAGKRGKDIHNRKLREVFGPSVPGMFINDAVQRGLQGAIRTRFPIALDQELNYLRSKAKK